MPRWPRSVREGIVCHTAPMFFLASKLLAFLFQPTNWLLALLAWAFCSRDERRRRRLVGAALVLGMVGTSPLIRNLALGLWEPEGLTVAAIEQPYDVAIVLGGLSLARTEPQDRLYLNENGNRLTQALELHGRGKVRKILFSGGFAPILNETESEAARVARFLDRLGFPRADLLLEERSRNTYENALNCREVLAALSQEGAGEASTKLRVLLLTDGFHMRRALACFARAGVEVDPFVTSRIARPVEIRHLETWLFPSAGALRDGGRLTRELFGILAYAATGKI